MKAHPHFHAMMAPTPGDRTLNRADVQAASRAARAQRDAAASIAWAKRLAWAGLLLGLVGWVPALRSAPRALVQSPGPICAHGADIPGSRSSCSRILARRHRPVVHVAAAFLPSRALALLLGASRAGRAGARLGAATPLRPRSPCGGPHAADAGGA